MDAIDVGFSPSALSSSFACPVPSGHSNELAEVAVRPRLQGAALDPVANCRRGHAKPASGGVDREPFIGIAVRVTVTLTLKVAVTLTVMGIERGEWRRYVVHEGYPYREGHR